MLLVPVAAYLLREPIRRLPQLFYLLAAGIAAITIYLSLAAPSDAILRGITAYLQHGILQFVLFVVVMYIGVLPDDSKLRTRLVPVRAQLSIIAAILTAGHIVPYLNNYLIMFANRIAIKIHVMLSLGIALVMLALLLILFITSINAVKKRLEANSWKRVQRLAYPFFLLIWVHLSFFMLPAAVGGGMVAIINASIYSLVFIAWLILRIRKH
jgi:DMSO/TMAO reductase YedYZ heme-binding membrane subunit